MAASKVEPRVSTSRNVHVGRFVLLPLSSGWAAALLVSDLLLFGLAAYLAGTVVDNTGSVQSALARFRASGAVFVSVGVTMFWVCGLYRRLLALSYRDEFYFTIVAITFGVAPQLMAFTLIPAWSVSRLTLVLSALFAIGLVGVSRAVFHILRDSTLRTQPRRILVCGQADDIEAVMTRLHRADNPSPIVFTLAQTSAQGTIVSAANAARRWRCESIILASPVDGDAAQRLISVGDRFGISVSFIAPPFADGVHGLSINNLGTLCIINVSSPYICNPTAVLIKRVMDLTMAGALIILTSPLMAVCALLIYLESGPPVLFMQGRVGRYGRAFRMLKFRTMIPNAGASWAQPGDPRITRIGAVLRKLSLDELPQLLNVLRGEMSMVGPRPEMQPFEEDFARQVPFYADRRLALPGITGWAQVNLKRNLTPEDVYDVLALDLSYIRNWSVFLDLTIILKTVAEFLFHAAV